MSKIMTRIKESQAEFSDRTTNDPKFLLLNEGDEHELLFWIQEQRKLRLSRAQMVDINEPPPPGTLRGCQVMGMHILLDKDVLRLNNHQ